MDETSNYKNLHSHVRAFMTAQQLGPFEGDNLRNALVGESLMEVEVIRGAVCRLMGSGGSEFAIDVLLCLLGEAQQVKLQRLPDMDIDSVLFRDCEDDENIYRYIHAGLAKRPNR